MGIRSFIRRLIYGPKADSAQYIAHLRKLGVRIGENVSIYTPVKTTIDECYPWMLTIGSNVKIAQGVIILNHDYSWSVLKGVSGGVLGSSGKVTIGDNVFIGMNAVITPNVTIGNNVVIGAGSVVTRDCPDNGVYAGNPARKIMELDAFFEKRRAAQLAEAKELAEAYRDRFGHQPPEKVFHEYFMLFENTDSVKKKHWCMEKMRKGANYEMSLAYLEKNRPLFEDYNHFMRYCFPDESSEK